MRPITCQSREYYRSVRLAGYRVLAFWVIGAMLIALGVIGLAGALVIRPTKISENITGPDFRDYYPGYYQGPQRAP